MDEAQAAGGEEMSEAKKYTKAKEKLAAELKATVTREDFRLLESHVCAALTEFCRQSEAFAAAVLESKKKLSDCTASLVSSGARCLDAREAYRRAAKFYLPSAEVEENISFRITVPGERRDVSSLSLDDLIGGGI